MTTPSPVGTAARLEASPPQTSPRFHRAGPWLLRSSLATVLVWFGALKIAGIPTMPSALIAAITPGFLDADLLVGVSGGLEVLLGAGLVLRRFQRVVLAGVAAQMSATFLVLLLRSDVAFIDGNLLTPSVEGEYVIKNLVLLAAALALIGQQTWRSTTSRERLTEQVPAIEGPASHHHERDEP